MLSILARANGAISSAIFLIVPRNRWKGRKHPIKKSKRSKQKVKAVNPFLPRQGEIMIKCGSKEGKVRLGKEEVNNDHESHDVANETQIKTTTHRGKSV